MPLGLGFRALKGGGVVVGVVVDEDGPRIVLSTFLPTAADGDRLALGPSQQFQRYFERHLMPQIK